MPLHLSNPRAIVERGEAIYSRCYQAEFEQRQRGKFVIIDIESERAFVADTPEDALTTALETCADGQFHLIQIGYKGAFRHSICL